MRRRRRWPKPGDAIKAGQPIGASVSVQELVALLEDVADRVAQVGT